MRRIVIVLAVMLLAAGTGFGDYVTLDDHYSVGSGYYQYHYTYYRTGSPLVDNQATWELLNIGGLDGPLADSTGPVYWDAGVFINNYTGVLWTYTGGETEGEEQDNYTTFDLRVQHPGGHTALTNYEVDTDGDGTPDSTAEVGGPTPEPTTLALALVGLGAIAVRRRRA